VRLARPRSRTSRSARRRPLVGWRLDRLGRSLRDLLDVSETLSLSLIAQWCCTLDLRQGTAVAIALNRINMTTFNGRTADHPIDPLFLERWSPRAFFDETISTEEFLTILEAGRWAPSSYNSQPWRFLYALRGTPHWEPFLGFLSDFNRSWAARASALIIIVSKGTMRPPGAQADVPSHTHSFDTGAAWAQIALQATRMGWHAHGMIGFDRDRAFAELHVPEGYRVEAAIAIGRKGDKSTLPEMLQQREMPSLREPLSSTAFEGGFPL